MRSRTVYDVIGDLVMSMRFYGNAVEVGDSSEAASEIAGSSDGEEKDIIYNVPGRPRPVLIRTVREGDVVAMALLDLDDVRLLPIRLDADKVEGVTQRIGFEKFGDRGLAPFMFPLMEMDDGLYVAMGLKTALPIGLLTGGKIDELLDFMEVYGDELYNAIVEGLRGGGNST